MPTVPINALDEAEIAIPFINLIGVTQLPSVEWQSIVKISLPA